MFFIRLYRLIPMLVVLGVTALLIYFITSLRATKPLAKRNVLLFFTWAFGLTTVFFTLATLYAWAEDNLNVTELLGSFAVACLIFLIITRICWRVFIGHYPNYASNASFSHTVTGFERVIGWVRSVMGGKIPESPVDAKGEDSRPSVKESAEKQSE